MIWYMQSLRGDSVKMVDGRGNPVEDVERQLHKFLPYAPDVNDRRKYGAERRGEYVSGYLHSDTLDEDHREGNAIFCAVCSELVQPGAERYFYAGFDALGCQIGDLEKQALLRLVSDLVILRQNSRAKWIVAAIAAAIAMILYLIFR